MTKPRRKQLDLLDEGIDQYLGMDVFGLSENEKSGGAKSIVEVGTQL